MQVFLKILKFLAPYLLKWVERGIVAFVAWYRKNHPDFDERVEKTTKSAVLKAGSLAVQANAWVRSLMERTGETAKRAKEKVSRRPVENRRADPEEEPETAEKEPSERPDLTRRAGKWLGDMAGNAVEAARRAGGRLVDKTPDSAKGAEEPPEPPDRSRETDLSEPADEEPRGEPDEPAESNAEFSRRMEELVRRVREARGR